MNVIEKNGGEHLRNYSTKLGDLWDAIAKQEMGDERFMPILMRANPEYIDYDCFPAGIVLKIPSIKKSSIVNLPPWRR